MLEELPRRRIELVRTERRTRRRLHGGSLATHRRSWSHLRAMEVSPVGMTAHTRGRDWCDMPANVVQRAGDRTHTRRPCCTDPRAAVVPHARDGTPTHGRSRSHPSARALRPVRPHASETRVRACRCIHVTCGDDFRFARCEHVANRSWV